MRRSLPAFVIGLLSLTVPAAADEEAAAAGFAERIAAMEPQSGLLSFHLDREAGRVWLEVPPADAFGAVGEYLYVEGLLTGLGSNPVGLDRGQLGRSRRVRLRRVGGKLLVEERNLGFRAAGGSAAEHLAAEQSFATSVLWAGAIEAPSEDGRGLVDLTPFLIRDAHGVVATLRDTGQGDYRLDPERSAVDLDACLALPDNLEFEAVLTWVSDRPGPLVGATAPSGEAVTLVQHHSLVRVPPPGYRSRAFDPRSGSFAIGFSDYSAPLDQPLEQRWLVRHRLEKTDPAAASGPVREPIVYYVDPAIPEPVRGAVLDGARWWQQAFEAAGFEDAFQVEMLPDGYHPLDARYNVIQWVHRSTRGWSYGGGVVDPLTGEMVKGHVTLGSLRVRQDRLLFEGLLGTAKTGSGAADDPVELALARIRQLSAHEVGHTLGLAHNFAASTYGRASVMDYPAPLIEVGEDGAFDVGSAYGVGVGEWDLQAVRYAYSEFPPDADEAAALAAIVDDGLARGLVFLSDADARPPGAAQPLASLWDNGDDAVAQLELELAVRRRALSRFGAANVAPGQPLALLEEVLATVYLRHRYQLEAAAKVIAGVDYRYALRGDGQAPAAPLPAAEQRRAIEVLLGALDPAELDLGDELLGLLLPRPHGYWPHRELFEHATAPVFDVLGAAATAADMVLAALLQAERAARLVDQHRRRPELPGLDELLEAVDRAVFRDAGGERPRWLEIRHVVQRVAVARLIALAAGASSPAVRARCDWQLERLAARLDGAVADAASAAHRAALVRSIRHHLERPGPPREEPPAAAEPPPGSPIGGGAMSAPDLGGCSLAPPTGHGAGRRP